MFRFDEPDATPVPVNASINPTIFAQVSNNCALKVPPFSLGKLRNSQKHDLIRVARHQRCQVWRAPPVFTRAEMPMALLRRRAAPTRIPGQNAPAVLLPAW